MVDLAPWRSPLARALHRNRALPYARYVQLATVREDGIPANRTVVFRGFSGDGHLQIVTDQRSEKIRHIASNPWAEVCWYFPKTREQFRLTGVLALIGADCDDDGLCAVRQALWQGLSEGGRSQFTWPLPGQARDDEGAFHTEPPSPEHPVDQFCALLLAPKRVDHLELRGAPQNRWIYELADTGEWRVQAVNP